MADFNATARVRVDLGQFTAAAREASAAGGAWDTTLSALQRSLSGIEATDKATAQGIANTLNLYRQLAGSVNTYTQATDRMARSNASATQAAQGFNTALEQMDRSLRSVRGMGDEEAQRLRNTLGLYQQMASAVNTHSASLRSMNDLTARAAGNGQQLFNSMQNQANAANASATATSRSAASMQDAVEHTMALRYAMYDLIGVYQQSATALMAFPRAAVTAAAEYETAFAQVARTTDATSTQLGDLQQDLMDMGSEIPLAFEQTAEIASFGSQMGIAAQDLEGFTRVVAEFSATTNVSADQASKSFGRISNLLGVLPAEYRNLASSVSELGDNSAATETDILAVIEQIAASSAQAGLTTQTVLGLSSALASLRIAPEAARGSTERLFGDMEAAVDGVNGNLQTYSQLIGLSAEQTQQLWETNPDEFFMRFIQGLERTTEAGGSVAQVMTELGIANVRDINMVQRLAGNYGLLAQSMDTAYSSYAQGTYLGEESAVVFGTFESTLTKLINTMRNFAAGAGMPIISALTVMMEVANNFIQFINNPFTQGIGTIVALAATAGAAFLGWRISIATAMAAMLALQYVTAQTAAIGGVSLRGLGTMAAQTFGTMSTGAAAAGASMTGFGAATAAGSATAATGMGTAATAATALRTAIAAIPGWGWALAGVSALVGLAAAYNSLSSSAEEGSARIGASAEALTAVGGGFEGLRQAVAADTALYQETGEAFRTIGQNASGAAGGLTEAEQAAAAAQQRLGVLGSQMDAAAGSTQNVDASGREAQGGLYAAADGFRVAGDAAAGAAQSYSGSTAALGENTRAWIVEAVKLSDELKAITEDPELYNQFQELGIDLNAAIEAGLREEGGATEYLRAELERAGVSAGETTGFLRQLANAANYVVPGMSDSAQSTNDLAMQLDSLGAAIDGQSSQVTGAQRANELLGSSMADTGAAGSQAAAGMDTAGGAADAMAAQMQQAQANADALRSALTGFGSATDAWRNAQEAANRRRSGGGGGGGSSTRRASPPSGAQLDNGAVESAKKQYDAIRQWAQAQERAVTAAAKRQHDQTVKWARAQEQATVAAAQKQHDELVKAMRAYEKQADDAEKAAQKRLNDAEKAQSEADKAAQDSAKAEEDAAARKVNAQRQLEAAVESRRAAELGLANANPQNQIQWQRALEAAIRNEAAARAEASKAASEHTRAQDANTAAQRNAEAASKAVLDLTAALERAQVQAARAQELSAQRQEASAERLAQVQEQAAARSAAIQEQSAARLEQIQANAQTVREQREAAAQAKYEAAQERRRVLEDQARAATEANNSAASASTAQFAEDATVSLDAYLLELAKIVEAQQNWVTNMLELAGRLPPGVAMELAKLGPEAAPLVQQLVDGTDTQLQEFSGLFMQTTDDGVQGMVDILMGGIPLAEGAAGDVGSALVYEFLEEMRAGERPVEEIVADYADKINELEDVDPTSTPQVDTERAEQNLRAHVNALNEANNIEVSTTPRLRTRTFWDQLGSFARSALEWSSWFAGLFVASPRFNAGGRVQRFADGGPIGSINQGWIRGPGGPREDRIPVLASDQEFIINARSATKHAALIEAINADDARRMSQALDTYRFSEAVQARAARPSIPPTYAAAASRSGQDAARTAWNITVNNQYPQAEPTSTTINRTLQYATALGDLG